MRREEIPARPSSFNMAASAAPASAASYLEEMRGCVREVIGALDTIEEGLK
jgi:hypothetical protein